MFANHKRGIFSLKRASWDESRRGGFPIKFEVLGWRHIKVFFAYVQLPFMLRYRIHGFLLTELAVRKAFQSYVFHLSIERAAMKTKHSVNI